MLHRPVDSFSRSVLKTVYQPDHPGNDTQGDQCRIQREPVRRAVRQSIDYEQEQPRVLRPKGNIQPAGFGRLTHDYVLPADACNSYTYLFGKMKEFEDDLFQHIHLENNILFPKALQL